MMFQGRGNEWRTVMTFGIPSETANVMATEPIRTTLRSVGVRFVAIF
jgi:hypothetical protein